MGRDYDTYALVGYRIEKKRFYAECSVKTDCKHQKTELKRFCDKCNDYSVKCDHKRCASDHTWCRECKQRVYQTHGGLLIWKDYIRAHVNVQGAPHDNDEPYSIAGFFRVITPLNDDASDYFYISVLADVVDDFDCQNAGAAALPIPPRNVDLIANGARTWEAFATQQSIDVGGELCFWVVVGY